MDKTALTLDTLLETLKKNNNSDDLALVEKAYQYAESKHNGQVRKSGEPYIIHPINVAHIVADFGLDAHSVCAALLHDVVEDTEASYDDIKSEFGETVAMLVDGVTKLGKIQTSSKEEQQIENLRKMFFAMTKDIRVIVVKLADRLHNMRTLKYMPEEKQRYIARETLEVYAPLAHRLGMSKIKAELEDLSLRYIDPIGYYEIVDKINQKRSEREAFINEIIDILKPRLTEVLGFEPFIVGRAKHFYSIYRKMYMQNKTLEELYDLFAVRVIVDNVSQCYTVLGTVHELFKPMPGRFKDYIAMPKPNMYQSLHSTLIGTDGRPFEIQIRTHEMHYTAENGIAAHWKYKQGVKASDEIDRKLEWIKQLLDIQKEGNAEEFMQALKIDMFSDEVFVFTPKGEVISLPANATPIDFAYSIHSAVGNRMTGAKANGKIVNLDYTLKNGDIVEVITSKSETAGPKRDWIKMCKTSQARNKINQWFKKVNREENIETGKEYLEKELKKNSLPLSFLDDKAQIAEIGKKYGFNSIDDILAGIGFGSPNGMRFVGRFITECKKKSATDEPMSLEELISMTPKAPEKANNSGVIVEGIDNCLTRFSHCCNPVPGDKIVGYVTRGRGVAIHRADCINILNSTTADSGRLINVRWANDNASSSFRSSLTVTSTDRANLLLDITVAVSELKITLSSVNARMAKNNLAIIDLTMEISDTNQLDTAINKIKAIDGIISVVRRRQ